MSRRFDRRNGGQKSAIPDRWEAYSNAGTRIPGTRFICMKVPLKQELCRKVAVEQSFTPEEMVRQLSERGMNLRLLIDLTNTYRYYHPNEVERLGIVYAKIMVQGHEVPGSTEIKRFFDIVERFEAEHGVSGDDNQDDSIVIGVHCTHGINRTGYLVCRYLIDRKGWTVEKAIKEFNSARGHAIERENYLQALQGPAPSVSLELRSVEPMDKEEDGRRPFLTSMPFRYPHQDDHHSQYRRRLSNDIPDRYQNSNGNVYRHLERSTSSQGYSRYPRNEYADYPRRNDWEERRESKYDRNPYRWNSNSSSNRQDRDQGRDRDRHYHPYR